MADTVAVIGSREGFPGRVVSLFVSTLEPGTTVISGGARGVDTAAELAARERGLEVEVIPANWNLGPQAGHLRNAQIARKADWVTALWNGESKGALGAIRAAVLQGKTALVIWPRKRHLDPAPPSQLRLGL